MKKITKPRQNEEAVYYSDFSGKCFGEAPAPIELKIEFGYGSEYDGTTLKFDLDDEDIKDILSLLKAKLNVNTKKLIKQKRKDLDLRYEGSVQTRDWTDCDYISNETDLLKKLI